MSKVILKPGILVALSVRMQGGVHYAKKDLESGEDDAGQEIVRWETERTIADRAEHDAATKCRSACRTRVTKVCTHTSFGLLCPTTSEADLDAAVAEARELAEAFNKDARHSRVHVYVLKGRIAESDEEATRAIAGEVRDLLDEMEAGIRSVDPARIREAADRAKKLGAVLDDSRADAVKRAVDIARKAAKEIVKRVEKGGEDAKVVLDEIATRPIELARFAFLDLEVDDTPLREPEGENIPAIDVQRFADLEIENRIRDVLTVCVGTEEAKKIEIYEGD